jgi:LPPG:FO 2-phospho-L-lactate transferase
MDSPYGPSAGAPCQDADVRIVVLAGGVGGARFLRGLREQLAAHSPESTVTAVINTADDITLHGLRICPDLDTVMYTLGGGIDDERGWGRREETFNASEELAAYGTGPSWFGLGDRDLATHLIRTRMLDAGYPLSEVTAALCRRWSPGVELLPMSDTRVETHVVVEVDGERQAIHFQEWWLKWRASLPALEFVQVGIEDCQPAPGVLEAIAAADAVVFAPSNPVVSVGPILAVPGIADAVKARPVVGVSPIVGGAPVRGHADACLAAIGVETAADAVALHYGSRRDAGLLDAWVMDEADASLVARLDDSGIKAVAVPAIMHTVQDAARLAASVLEVARAR